MYEAYTFDFLLERMLAKVPDVLDKREGSIIYDALAPAAAELAQMYMELDLNLDLSFADTATGEYLERRAADFGLNRQQATPAQRRAIFYDAEDGKLEIPLQSRFSAGNTNFKVVRRLDAGEYMVECELAGIIGNQSYGALVPIQYIAGLARAELAEVVVPGKEAESDEALRSRYLTRVQTPSAGGNLYDYKNWALEVPGVGAVKVHPLWSGPGTVKTVIADSDKLPPTAELVQQVREHIEQLRPIGAQVTVSPALGKSIEVDSTVALAPGYTLQEVSDSLSLELQAYFRSMAFVDSYVSVARVGTLLLGIPGVADYSELKLNGGSANIALEAEEVPLAGAIRLGV